MDDVADIALTAAYLLGVGAFVALRDRHGFWGAYALGFAAALALLLGTYVVLGWGPLAVILLVLLYMGLIALMQLSPLLLLLPLLHVALLWLARRRMPKTGS
jgi:hypothetical protein